ncbi:MAG: tRNA-intron lyase [Candidatus ainarchaeum sp.]|nr:tRNA-intron lyase [Candidatus ainarchaeum sp.]
MKKENDTINSLIENKIIVENNNLKSRLVEKGFGEKTERELILDLFEGLYLIEKNKLKIKLLNGKKLIKKNELIEIGIKFDKKFYSKYLVYQDLREKGYCIKTGLKFGFDFRIYPKGKKMGEMHSEYGLNVLKESEKLNMTQISRLTRLAGNIHIKSIIAVIDNENSINYYEINRKLFN